MRKEAGASARRDVGINGGKCITSRKQILGDEVGVVMGKPLEKTCVCSCSISVRICENRRPKIHDTVTEESLL